MMNLAFVRGISCPDVPLRGRSVRCAVAGTGRATRARPQVWHARARAQPRCRRVRAATSASSSGYRGQQGAPAPRVPHCVWGGSGSGALVRCRPRGVPPRGGYDALRGAVTGRWGPIRSEIIFGAPAAPRARVAAPPARRRADLRGARTRATGGECAGVPALVLT